MLSGLFPVRPFSGAHKPGVEIGWRHRADRGEIDDLEIEDQKVGPAVQGINV